MDVVKDIMTRKVITCSPKGTILEIQGLMVKHRISRVVVVDIERNPVGIATQKDVVGFLLRDTSERDIEEIHIQEVMSRNLITIKPTAPIHDAAKSMIEEKISSLVVVGDDGKLKGIVTKADICLYLASKGAGIYSVSDFMTSNPLTVRQSQSIFLAASLMYENKVSRVVVIDRDDKPAGVITLTDVTMISTLLKPARMMREKTPLFLKGILFPPKGIHLLTAKDFMTAHPVVIKEDRDLAIAARLMLKHGFSGLPVVKDAEKLVGILTKSDLTRAVASLKE